MSTATIPAPSHMEERIDLLTKELAAKRRSTNWSSNLTLVLGLLAILMLCGYFGYGYYALDDMTQPKTIVASATTYINDFSEEARRAAAEEVRKSAPIWAQEASKELVANMPSIRATAEDTIAGYFDQQLDETQSATRREFSRIMQEHREVFEEAINIVVEDNKADEFSDKILPIIEENYAGDLRSSVANVLGGLQDFNKRLDKLAAGKDLNPIEEQQRHIIGLTRLVQE